MREFSLFEYAFVAALLALSLSVGINVQKQDVKRREQLSLDMQVDKLASLLPSNKPEQMTWSFCFQSCDVLQQWSQHVARFATNVKTQVSREKRHNRTDKGEEDCICTVQFYISLDGNGKTQQTETETETEKP